MRVCVCVCVCEDRSLFYVLGAIVYFVCVCYLSNVFLFVFKVIIVMSMHMCVSMCYEGFDIKKSKR